jgi:quinol monooxygenase YgiN
VVGLCEPLWLATTDAENAVAGFVQIIEFKSSRVDEIRELVEEMRSELGNSGGALRGTVTTDRDRPGYHLNIVEFESRESAMENSNRPEVSQFAARMAALCDEPPRFYNLDVVEPWEDSSGPSLKTVAAGAATVAAGVAVAAAVASKPDDETTEQKVVDAEYIEPVVVTETAPVEPLPPATSTESVRHPGSQDPPR